MKKILTIGGGMRDIFIQHDHPETVEIQIDHTKKRFIILEEGKKIEVQELEYFVGGGAANSAVLFVKCGFESASFFKVGTDRNGDEIIESLQKAQVNTEYIITTDEAATGTSFIIPSPSGNRSVLVYRGANLTLQKSDIPEDAIKSCDQLYITSLSGPTAQFLAPITKLAKKYNVSIAANPGTSQLTAGANLVAESLPHIDILILNAYEAELLMNSLTLLATKKNKPIKSQKNMPLLLKKPLSSTATFFALRDFIKIILSRGPRIVVVTNGAEGVYIGTHDTIYFHPSIKTKVVSTLGAGDAFGSCFVAQIMHGKPIEDALRMGILNSNSVIEHLDTQTGLLKQDELEKKLSQLDRNLLQKY